MTTEQRLAEIDRLTAVLRLELDGSDILAQIRRRAAERLRELLSDPNAPHPFYDAVGPHVLVRSDGIARRSDGRQVGSRARTHIILKDGSMLIVE